MENLSSNVAHISRYLGNSINQSPGPANAGFLYDYYGYHGLFQADFRLEDGWEIGLKSNWLFNRGAPDGQNRGVLGRLSLSKSFKSIIYKGSFGLFENQSDSSVSFYNSKFYGNNNARGFVINASFIETDFDMEVGLALSRSNVIRAVNPYKEDATTIELSFKRSYDLF